MNISRKPCGIERTIWKLDITEKNGGKMREGGWEEQDQTYVLGWEMEKKVIWGFRQVTSPNINYFWLKGNKVKKLMKYSLSRLRIKQRMCGVILHAPNCNSGQPVCIGPGRWNMWLESQPGRELLLTMWIQNDGSGMTKFVERNTYWKIPNWQLSKILGLSQTEEVVTSLNPPTPASSHMLRPTIRQ